MTMTAAERSSIESARNVLSKLMPKDTLTPVLEYFSRVIEWVDKPSGGLWSITLNAANVKLNVGDLLIFVISKDRVELTVPKEMKALFPSESFKDFNPDVNSCSCCRFIKEPAASFRDTPAAITSAHQKLVQDRAHRKNPVRTQLRAAHSEGVLLFLEEYLHAQGIPRPSYRAAPDGSRRPGHTPVAGSPPAYRRPACGSSAT